MSNQPKKSRIVWIVLAVVLPLVCVACLAMLASIGLPAFLGYVKRAKTSEVSSNLFAMYQGAASYYATSEHCIVGPSVTTNTPGSDATRIDYLSEEFEAIGFSPAGFSYFQYEIVSAGASCGNEPGSSLYTFVAHGDLDGDGIRSRFELTVGSDVNNEMFRAPGIYIENELE